MISTIFKETYQEVRLSYRVLSSNGDQYLVEVHPHSGKFHQIRAQLAAIGCPILGDEKYGGEAIAEERVIALHARSLTIWDPLGEERIRLEAPLPANELWREF